MVNKSGTITASKGCKMVITKKGYKSENITFIVGCNAVILYRFLITRIVKIFPQGPDPQLVPVTRRRSSRLFSSCDPINSSVTQCHYSKVLNCLYTIGKRLFFFTDPQLVRGV